MAPNAIDLTTLVAVKQRATVGVQPNGTIFPTQDDNEIQAAITAFSAWLLDYTGQGSLNSTAVYTDVYDGNGNTKLFLRSYPIVNLTSVTIDGVSVPITTGQAFNSWGAFIDQSAKSIGVRGGIGANASYPYQIYTQYGGIGRCGPTFNIGRANIVVEYTAGFTPLTIENELDTVNANTITLQSAPWVADGGLKYYPSFTPLTVVNASPTVGEYAVSDGLYVFNTGDNTNVVAVNYEVNAAPQDLEYAVRCVVAINYKRKGWQDQEMRSVAAKDSTANTRYQSWTWPPEYDKIFQHYKRMALYS
jgi:hypothetical protein